MKLRRLESLPSLAWVARHDSDSGLEVFAGTQVEAFEDRVFEGAWAGDFGEGDFERACSFTGSGLVVRDEVIAFVPPATLTEAIYSLEGHDGFYVGNTLAGLLTFAGLEVDIERLDYEERALSIADGIDHYIEEIPLAGGVVVRQHYSRNLEFRVQDRSVRQVPKDLAPSLSSFQEYRDFLKQTYGQVVSNATDARRRVAYAPIVFCSTGYDSTACAVLAREAGCTEAVAFESKKSRRSDSGADIARSLGYEVIHELDERKYLEVDSAEYFLGNGELGTSVFFAAAQERLHGRLLVSGAHGDKMWERGYTEDVLFRRGKFPSAAKKEFRLKTGFISIAPALITGFQQHMISSITSGEEMLPWTLGTDYDRPIARRIAEQGGVPRDWFGVHKSGGAGSSFRFGDRRYLSRTMPTESFARFEPFMRKAAKRRRKTLAWAVRSFVYLVYVFATLARIKGFHLPARVLRLDEWATRYTCSPFAPSFLFAWAVSELREREYWELTRK